nr:reverse transcriptase domain-containing protein [Tanacetum cinerariifolium]
MREDSQNLSAKTLSARYRNPLERPQIRDRLKNNDENVFGRLCQRRQSAFKRLSDTYSPSTTKSEPDKEYSRDGSYSRGRPHKRGSSPSRDRPRSRDRSHGIKKSYGNTYPFNITWDKHRYYSHGTRQSRSTKRERNIESPLSRMSESDTREGGHLKSKSKRRKPTYEDLAAPWSCEETVGEMMIATTAFIRGETAAASKKKVHTPWKSQDQSKRETSEQRSNFRNQSRDGRGSNKFAPLTRTPKEIFAASSGKFKPPSPIVTPVEKRSSNKFCEFHNDKGHSTDECVQLRKQIEELVRAGKLSHFIKEIKRDRDQQKTGRKDAPVKDKVASIYMIQPWQRMKRQKVTQNFAHVKEITFPPLAANKGTWGPLVIETEISGHAVHRIYVDGGSSMEVHYEHCFNRLRSEIKSQMFPATTSLTDFSGETIWPLGQLRLLVTIEDAEHYTRAWINFMIVRSPSPYNDIIGRPGIREIQAIPSTAHGMLKFPVKGGIVTIHSTILTPTECTTIATTPKDHAKMVEIRHKNFKVAIHPDFPDEEIIIGGKVSIKARTELCTHLKRNLDIFAWQPSDMTGVTPSIAEHRLNRQEFCEKYTITTGYPTQSWIVTPFQKTIGRSNPSAATPLSVSWTPTNAIIKYRWPNKMRKKTAFHTSHGDNSSLIDLPVGGLPFTWMNKVGTKLSELDRFLISEEVVDAFHDVRVTAIYRLWSDHNIILLYVSKSGFSPTPLKLFHSWLLRDIFDNVIKTELPKLEEHNFGRKLLSH